MMFKRVHFAPTNTIYEPGSETPSPSLTISSLPSSSSSPEILTPPPEEENVERIRTYYPPTPYSKFMDLYPSETPIMFSEPVYPTTEPVFPERAQIHCMLAYTPYTKPPVDYDLSLQPSAINRLYQPHAFTEPATSPAVHVLRIRHPLIRFEMEVSASPPVGGSYVTVDDVFIGLYREFRLPILPIEYAELPEGEVKASVDRAYYTRCARIFDPEERMHEERKGIKRIDLLMGRTRFMGLSGTASDPDLWELNVS